MSSPPPLARAASSLKTFNVRTAGQQGSKAPTENAKRMRKVLAEREAARMAEMAAQVAMNDAANTIQEFVREHLASKGCDATSRAKWPKLWELRQLFMDENAVDAGAAAEDTFYSDEIMLQRALLREDKQVVTALKEAWESLLPPGSKTLTKQAYWEVGRRMYLALAIQGKSVDVDAYDCIDRIGGDWMDDSDDHGVIDYDGFQQARLRHRLQHRLEQRQHQHQHPHPRHQHQHRHHAGVVPAGRPAHRRRGRRALRQVDPQLHAAGRHRSRTPRPLRTASS